MLCCLPRRFDKMTLSDCVAKDTRVSQTPNMTHSERRPQDKLRNKARWDPRARLLEKLLKHPEMKRLGDIKVVKYSVNAPGEDASRHRAVSQVPALAKPFQGSRFPGMRDITSA